MEQEVYMLAQRNLAYAEEEYRPAQDRYEKMLYKRCGHSGLLLPAISFGSYLNFDISHPYVKQRELLLTAFDLGIVHLDCANQYGPYFGQAEQVFGKIIKNNLMPYRDELCISTKAGFEMWRGPYGEHGSRKHIIASMDQSLRRLGLDYVDIFYHHRPDERTPLEETMTALSDLVKRGKARYIGLSRYPVSMLRKASQIMKRLGTPILVAQYGYSMFERDTEQEIQSALEDEGIGMESFFSLAQGFLTNRYFNGIPEDSRASVADQSRDGINKRVVTNDKIKAAIELNDIAQKRGQSLAQMALAWTQRNPVVVTTCVGASKPEQLRENVKMLEHIDFTIQELQLIDEILSKYNISIKW